MRSQCAAYLNPINYVALRDKLLHRRDSLQRSTALRHRMKFRRRYVLVKILASTSWCDLRTCGNLELKYE